MTLTANAGDANALAGDFGETWLQVVAASCGILHGRPSTLDFDKADVELTLLQEVGNTYRPCVKVQVKTTHDLRDSGTDLVYDLDVATYDVLRRTDHSVPRILVVIRLSDGDERLVVREDGTLLLGRGAWVSLEGAAATTNIATIAVKLPMANTLDADGLRRMLTGHGVRRSTPVPSIDPWTEEDRRD